MFGVLHSILILPYPKIIWAVEKLFNPKSEKFESGMWYPNCSGQRYSSLSVFGGSVSVFVPKYWSAQFSLVTLGN